FRQTVEPNEIGLSGLPAAPFRRLDGKGNAAPAALGEGFVSSLTRNASKVSQFWRVDHCHSAACDSAAAEILLTRALLRLLTRAPLSAFSADCRQTPLAIHHALSVVPWARKPARTARYRALDPV